MSLSDHTFSDSVSTSTGACANGGSVPDDSVRATIVDRLRERAALQPNTTGFRLLAKDAAATVITYQQLDEQARAVAAQLQAHGARGERVLLLYPYGADFIAAFFGCLYAGAIAVPLFPPRQNRVDERLVAVAVDAQATLALTTTKIAQSLTARQAPTTVMQRMQWLVPPPFTSSETAAVQTAAAAWQPHRPQSAALAFLQYTSGSTGLPKGVMVSHANLLHNAQLISQSFGINARTRGFMWTPFYHDMGLIGGIVMPIVSGSATDLMDPVDFLQQPVRWLQGISAAGATISGGPNFAYDLCVEKITPDQCTGLDLSTWTVAFCGAEPVRAATMARFAEKFAPYGFRKSAFTPCYGLAESTLLVSSTPQATPPVTLTVDAHALAENRVEVIPDPTAAAPATVQTLVSSGRAWRDQHFSIVDPEAGRPLPAERVGEIWISGPSVAQGYWNRAGTTAKIFNATLAVTDVGPFLRSGDLGFLRNGELFVTGRIKDLLIIRGKNHYPQDLEQTVAAAHPALREGFGAVFTVDGPNREHDVAPLDDVAQPDSVAQPRGVAQPNPVEQLVVVQEIERTHLRTLPVDAVFTAIQRAIAANHGLQVQTILLLRPGRIPKTTSGKIQRRATKQAFLAATLAVEHRWSQAVPVDHSLTAVPPALTAATSIQGWLVAQLAHRLQVAPTAIDLHQPFADFGLDSLAAVELVEELRFWLAQRDQVLALDPTVLWDYPTIAALATFLEEQAQLHQPHLHHEPVHTMEASTATSAVSHMTTTSPDLPQLLELLQRAQQRIGALEAQVATAGRPNAAPIAIVGMACRMPAADGSTLSTPAAFWEQLCQGYDAIAPLSAERRALGIAATPVVAAGGYLADIEQFDATFFGISGREAPYIDPQQRLLLELAWEALESGGIDPTSVAGTATGVYVGISGSDYAQLQQLSGPVSSPYSAPGAALGIAANRISYRFGLQGPSLAIDTACSSSLVALHHACQSLRNGESNGALVGGVNLLLTPTVTTVLAAAGMLAADERCKSFAADADGYVRSEGAVMLYLKRLADAERDGDPILAVIAGSAINQNGQSNGLTAPNGQAQQAVIRAALADAQISVAQLGYVEAHGTGSQLGDAIEVNALKAVLADDATYDPQLPCWLGTVKANIGSLEAASGLAGLLRSVLILRHNQIPAQVHFSAPNPTIDLSDSRLAIPTEPRAWPRTEHPRYLGVSAFGFGGTNAHVILTDAPATAVAHGRSTANEVAIDRQTPVPLPTAHLVTLSANSQPALRALALAYAEHLATNPHLCLADLAYTTNLGRAHFVVRLAIVATELAQVQTALGTFMAEPSASSSSFPTQGTDPHTLQLNELAKAYIAGATVDFAVLYPPNSDGSRHYQKLSLPTYPFQRQSYWIPTGRPLPMTTADAIDRRTAFPVTQASMPQSSEEIVETLQIMIAEQLRIDRAVVTPDTPLLALGADSLALMATVRLIEQQFDVVIPVRRCFEDLNTVTALADYIVQERTVAASAESARAASLPTPIAQQLLMIINKQLDLLSRYDLLAHATDAPLLPLLQQHLELTSTEDTPLRSMVAGADASAAHSIIPNTIAPAVSPQLPQQMPLNEAQQQLWFLSQFNEDAAIAYNETVTLHLRGELDVAALWSAVEELVDRHDALRTRIDHEGRYQEIVAEVDVELPVIPLYQQTERARATNLTTWLDAESRRPFDLAAAPLIRFSLLQLSPIGADSGGADYLLVMTAHHIIIDGLSILVLLDELAALYAAAVADEMPTLAPAPQFRTYLQRQQELLQTPQLAKQEQYWLQKLVGSLPVLELPTDRPHPPLQSYRGAVATVTIDRPLTVALKELSHRNGTTLSMTLFAAYALLLHRLSGQEDVIIGVPVAGRGVPGCDRVVGYCTHLLPIRHTLVGSPTFVELLHGVRHELLAAYEQQDVPFARLLNQLEIERDFSLSPVVGSVFNLSHRPTLPPFSGLAATLGPRPTSFVDHPLGVNIIDNDETLTVDFEYNTDLFDAATVARLATHFQTLVAALVDNPQHPAKTLPLLRAHERQQLLVEWNRTDYAFDTSKAYHELFEEQVAKTPDALAVLYRDQGLTYRELNALADRLATHFTAHIATQSIGSHSDESANLVALLCDRSPLFLAAVLGLFKVGAAYLPLDVRAPAARQAQVLGQSRTPLLLITGDYADLAAESLAELPADAQPMIVDLDMLSTDKKTEARERGDAPHITREPLGRASPLAYVIYTSGSTGLPKGAMVEQQGMINHLYAKIEDLGLTAADTVAQTAPQSFDISVWQFLSTLIIGGRVHIFPDEVAADPVALLEQSAAEEITILEVVPSLLRMMVDALADGVGVELSKLRWMIPTGEALPPNLARQWLHHCPQIPLVNAYGPTECSDDVTHYIISEPPASTVVNMPIGRPILNMRMYILDTSMQPVPIGVAGELYVGGIGVGHGYLHDPERTAAAFVPDPFSADPNARLYKTGDKARYLADGNIEYLGRLDYQVKIRGFRIELGEIEAVLEQHPALYQAIVMDQPDNTGSKRLVAYIVANGGTVGLWDSGGRGTVGQWDSETVQPSNRPTDTLSQTLRAYLSAHLPDYMIPAAFVELDALPLTPNGKVDRKAMPVPDFGQLDTSEALVPPRTPTEEALVTIWSDVLKVPAQKIGVHQNFFALGGHSLLATQAASRIRSAFQIELPLQTYFAEPTIADLANYIELTTWAAVSVTSRSQTADNSLTGTEEEGEL